jgi:5,10-methylene-tetrahydrofolate dehydrogenase/methenyl tetrahydrofolate cyclohydrolase
MQIIDGKKIKEEILAEVKKEISFLNFQPIFCDVLVGNDPSSVQYVQMKAKNAENIGIKFHQAFFPTTITNQELTEEIKKINKIPNMCGIIVQLPLPEHINKKLILDTIDPLLDVDCLGSIASEKFYNADVSMQSQLNATMTGLASLTCKSDLQTQVFPTALACMAILDSLDIDLKNKKIVVMGQGELVGKPVSALLNFRKLNFDIIDSKTIFSEKAKLLKEADLIISGIGQGKYITGDMLKNGVILIDAGTSEICDVKLGLGSGIVGDVDLESVKNIASFVSPVPGGVGPVTVAMLFKNVLSVARKLKMDSKVRPF